MSISAAQVKELRGMTGAGMMDCRKALMENDGNIQKAVEYLQKKSLAAASKKADRIAAEGAVGSYIHMGGRIGVICEINCETDFVAKTEQFQSFMRDVCMHIAAMNPAYLDSSEIPEDVVAKQRVLFADMMKSPGSRRISSKRLWTERSRSGSASLPDGSRVRKRSHNTIAQLVTQMVASIGENMRIRRFVRFELGEGLEKKNEDFAAEVAAAAGQA